MSELRGDCYIIQETPSLYDDCEDCCRLAEVRIINAKKRCIQCAGKLIAKAKFCIKVPEGVIVTTEMIERARQEAFG